MSVKQPSIDDVSVRLEQLAQLADSCRGAFHAVSAESHWRPTLGSAASAAQDLINHKDPASSGDGVMAGFDLVSEVVVTYLEIAAGHLGGLATLCRAGEVFFAPAPLVRSVMENSAHAMWVIGDKPGEPADILARAYLEEFASCESAKRAAEKIGSEEDDGYQQANRRRTIVRDRAIAAFPGTTRTDLSEKKPGRKIADQVLPGAVAGVKWMFELLHTRADGTVTEHQASGIYAFLSSGTHPSLYQVRQLRVPVDHGDHHGTILRMDVAFFERLLAAAVMPFYGALSYVLSFYGLDSTAHDKLTEEIDAVLPGFLT